MNDLDLQTYSRCPVCYEELDEMEVVDTDGQDIIVMYCEKCKMDQVLKDI